MFVGSGMRSNMYVCFFFCFDRVQCLCRVNAISWYVNKISIRSSFWNKLPKTQSFTKLDITRT